MVPREPGSSCSPRLESCRLPHPGTHGEPSGAAPRGDHVAQGEQPQNRDAVPAPLDQPLVLQLGEDTGDHFSPGPEVRRKQLVANPHSDGLDGAGCRGEIEQVAGDCCRTDP